MKYLAIIIMIGSCLAAMQRPGTPMPSLEDLIQVDQVDESLYASYCDVREIVHTIFELQREVCNGKDAIVLDPADSFDATDNQTETGVVLEWHQKIPTALYFRMGKWKFVRRAMINGNADELLMEKIIAAYGASAMSPTAKPNFSYVANPLPKPIYALEKVGNKKLGTAKFRQEKEKFFRPDVMFKQWILMRERYEKEKTKGTTE